MKKRVWLIPLTILLALIGATVLYQEANAPQSPFDENNQNNSSPPKPTFDKKAHSITKASSIWVIANKARPLQPSNYAPTDLVSVGGGQFLRKEAASAFNKLAAAAKKAGLTLLPLSGYRSYAMQVAVYNNEVARYGQATADRQSARPGHSEHQTGLAIDVGGGGCGIEDCFGNTAEGKWLAANGYKYGFIIRYVAGKEAITGYRPEPWHIRYVGTDLAKEMNRTGVQTLEEFFDAIERQAY